MKVVGLTGGIATGKSTLCHRIQEEGIPIVDCDKIAHSVVKNVSELCPEQGLWLLVVGFVSEQGVVFTGKMGT